jgi:hypothetical protein
MKLFLFVFFEEVQIESYSLLNSCDGNNKEKELTSRVYERVCRQNLINIA